MATKNLRSIQEIIKNCVPLQTTLSHVEKITKLQNIIKEMLEPPLREHCHVMSYRNGCLALAVDSSTWAHGLRYECPRLLQQGRQKEQLRGLANIKIQVQPRDEYIPKQLREPVTLSENSAAIIKQQAQWITDDIIRDAFLRLSENADQKKTNEQNE